VKKDHGDIGPGQLVVEIQVGVWQGGLGPLHNQAAYRLAEKPLENLPLLVRRVPGGKEHGGVVALSEKLLHVLEDGGEDVVVNIGGHDGDAAAAPDQRLRQHPGAAALPLFNEAQLHQALQRLPHSLAADLVALGQFLFRGQLVRKSALDNFRLKGGGQL